VFKRASLYSSAQVVFEKSLLLKTDFLFIGSIVHGRHIHCTNGDDLVGLDWLLVELGRFLGSGLSKPIY
jgi:hypothetical protein